MEEGKGGVGRKMLQHPHPIPGLKGQREEGPEVRWEMPKDLICEHGGEMSLWFHNLGYFPFSSFPRPFLFTSCLLPPLHLHLLFLCFPHGVILSGPGDSSPRLQNKGPGSER